jgi:hypothetical protein
MVDEPVAYDHRGGITFRTSDDHRSRDDSRTGYKHPGTGNEETCVSGNPDVRVSALCISRHSGTGKNYSSNCGHQSKFRFHNICFNSE